MVSIYDLAKEILEQDNNIGNCWRKIYLGMKLPVADLCQLELQYSNGQKKLIDIMIDILNQSNSIYGTTLYSELVRVLKEEKMIHLSEYLRTKHLDFTEASSSSLSKLPNNAKLKSNLDTPLWTKDCKKPNTDLPQDWRDEEVKEIVTQQTSGNCQMVNIMGVSGSGKSELARKFAYKFKSNNKGSCIWLSCKNLSADDAFITVWNSIIDKSINEDNLDLTKHFCDLSKCISGDRPWLLVVDHVKDKDSKDFVDKILDITKTISIKPKVFVVITSRKNFWESQTSGSQIHSMMLKDHKSIATLVCRGKFCEMVKNVTDDILQIVNTPVDKESCKWLKEFFQPFEKTGESIRAAFNFLIIIAFMVDVTNSDGFPKKSCMKVLVKLTKLNPDPKQVLKTIIEVPKRKEPNSRCKYSPLKIWLADVACTIKRKFLEHSRVTLILEKSLGLNNADEVTLLELLLDALKQCNLSQESTSAMQQNMAILIRNTLQYPKLFCAYHEQIFQWCLSCDSAIMNIVYSEFKKQFGDDYDLSIQIEVKLAEAYFKDQKYAKAHSIFEKYYQLALSKEDKGATHDDTMQNGMALVNCLEMQQKHNEAIKIVTEMVKNCESTFGPNAEITVLRKLDKANLLHKTDSEKNDASKIYKSIVHTFPQWSRFHIEAQSKLELLASKTL